MKTFLLTTLLGLWAETPFPVPSDLQGPVVSVRQVASMESCEQLRSEMNWKQTVYIMQDPDGDYEFYDYSCVSSAITPRTEMGFSR